VLKTLAGVAGAGVLLRPALTHDDSKYLSTSPKARYGVREERDPLSGEPRLRVYVLYADDFRIRALPPRFKDEKSMDAYLQRWNPELVGRRIDFDQLIAINPGLSRLRDTSS
jgi:hypothetical protein